MLPAFVIGLREGLEAALIVVIIATFLIKSGREDTMRAMWVGVGVAVLFCLGFGLARFTRVSSSWPISGIRASSSSRSSPASPRTTS